MNKNESCWFVQELNAAYFDGTRQSAGFHNPISFSKDSNGNLFVLESVVGAIRKVDCDGVVSTFAGSTAGFVDNVHRIKARFSAPSDLFCTKDSILIADTNNHRIRKIDSNDHTTTISGTRNGHLDGNTDEALFACPYSIYQCKDGFIYVTELMSCHIRRISPDGLVTTIPIQSTKTHYGSSLRFKISGMIDQRIFLQQKFEANLLEVDVSTQKTKEILTFQKPAKFEETCMTVCNDGEIIFSQVLPLSVQALTLNASTGEFAQIPISFGRWIKQKFGVNLQTQLEKVEFSDIEFDESKNVIHFLKPGYMGYIISVSVNDGTITSIGKPKDDAGVFFEKSSPIACPLFEPRTGHLIYCRSNAIRYIDYDGKFDYYVGSDQKGMKDGFGMEAKFWHTSSFCFIPIASSHYPECTRFSNGVTHYKHSDGKVYRVRSPMLICDSGNSLIRIVDDVGNVSLFAGDISKDGKNYMRNNRLSTRDGIKEEAIFYEPMSITVSGDFVIISELEKPQLRVIDRHGFVSTIESRELIRNDDYFRLCCDSSGFVYANTSFNLYGFDPKAHQLVPSETNASTHKETTFPKPSLLDLIVCFYSTISCFNGIDGTYVNAADGKMFKISKCETTDKKNTLEIDWNLDEIYWLCPPDDADSLTFPLNAPKIAMTMDSAGNLALFFDSELPCFHMYQRVPQLPTHPRYIEDLKILKERSFRDGFLSDMEIVLVKEVGNWSRYNFPLHKAVFFSRCNLEDSVLSKDSIKDISLALGKYIIEMKIKQDELESFFDLVYTENCTLPKRIDSIVELHIYYLEIYLLALFFNSTSVIDIILIRMLNLQSRVDFLFLLSKSLSTLQISVKHTNKLEILVSDIVSTIYDEYTSETARKCLDIILGTDSSVLTTRRPTKPISHIYQSQPLSTLSKDLSLLFYDNEGINLPFGAHNETCKIQQNNLQKFVECDFALVLSEDNHEKSFGVHKCILASRLPFFYGLFTSKWSDSSEKFVVPKKGDPGFLTLPALNALISFIYSDSYQIEESDFDVFLEAMSFYLSCSAEETLKKLRV